MIKFDPELTRIIFDDRTDSTVDLDVVEDFHPLGRRLMIHMGEDIVIHPPAGPAVTLACAGDEDVVDGETVAWNYSSPDGAWYLKINKG